MGVLGMIFLNLRGAGKTIEFPELAGKTGQIVVYCVWHWVWN